VPVQLNQPTNRLHLEIPKIRLTIKLEHFVDRATSGFFDSVVCVSHSPIQSLRHEATNGCFSSAAIADEE
jgi:hypothetical protein